MITEETVFIIGAGGSAPYGFPTGKQLSKLISAQFRETYKQLVKQAYIADPVVIDEILLQMNSFIDHYQKPDPSPIDIFISRNNEYSQIAKEAIVYFIISKEHENQNVKHTNTQMGHWYEYLFDRMTEDLTTRESGYTLVNNKTTFITFNYDRSMEKYIATRLTNRFFRGGPEYETVMKKIPFYHVHGKVGNLIWESSPIHEYGYQIGAVGIKELSSGLKIVYDKGEIDKQAKELITSAKRIFFLGFGYALENLRKIGIPFILRPGQKVFGTGFGLTPHEIELIKLNLNGDWVADWQKDIIIEPVDCLQLLRNHL